MAKTKPKLIYVCTAAGAYFSNVTGDKPIPADHELWTQRTDPVCVLGNVENHKLIREAIRKKTYLFVGKYLTEPPPVTPEGWFKRMSHQDKIPASLGGWKLLSEAGAKHYTTINSATLAEFQNHPAYLALAYSRSRYQATRQRVPLADAQRVLTAIGDPRWHNSPSGLLPPSDQFLRRTLGIAHDQLIGAMTTTNDEFKVRFPPGSFQRSVLNLAGLCGRRGFEDVFLLTEESETDFQGQEMVQNFINQQPGESDVAAYLREFFHFVLSVWLDATDSRRLFVPEYYFEPHGDTGEYYRRYADAFKKCLGTLKVEDPK